MLERNRTVGCRNLAVRHGTCPSSPLNAAGGSGECCAHIVALPFKKEKPGSLGESASKKILGDLTRPVKRNSNDGGRLHGDSSV